MVVIEQGVIAEAALNAIDGKIEYGMTDRGNFLVADWFSGGEMTVE